MLPLIWLVGEGIILKYGDISDASLHNDKKIYGSNIGIQNLKTHVNPFPFSVRYSTFITILAPEKCRPIIFSTRSNVYCYYHRKESCRLCTPY